MKDRIFLLSKPGAGAGLAAVYQVPLTVLSVFETLGITLSIKRFVLVGLTTYVSTI